MQLLNVAVVPPPDSQKRECDGPTCQAALLYISPSWKSSMNLLLVLLNQRLAYKDEHETFKLCPTVLLLLLSFLWYVLETYRSASAASSGGCSAAVDDCMCPNAAPTFCDWL